MTPLMRSRLTLIGVLSLFFVPMLLAWAWFSYAEKNGVEMGSRAVGQLLTQTTPLEEFTIVDEQGEDFTRENLRHIWSLLMVLPKECDQTCADFFHLSRQVHIALGKEALRVQRVLLPGAMAVTPQLRKDHPKLIVLTKGDALTLQLEQAAADLPACDTCIYLSDPLANVLMRFDPSMPDKAMLKDLKVLLKASRIG